MLLASIDKLLQKLGKQYLMLDDDEIMIVHDIKGILGLFMEAMTFLQSNTRGTIGKAVQYIVEIKAKYAVCK